MITLKDITDLNPYCKVWVVNIRDYDVVDMINNADRYIVTDMNAFENRLDVLVKRMVDVNIIRDYEKEG
jgi:hypothetical protein